jgi:hypothetical protein
MTWPALRPGWTSVEWDSKTMCEVQPRSTTTAALHASFLVTWTLFLWHLSTVSFIHGDVLL